MEKIIDVKGLAVSYEGKNILENVSFSVEEGDFLVIFGENGSGKTSLMKTLLNINKPSHGSVIFAGDLKRSGIGYLPQLSKIPKDFPASAEEVVLSGTLNKMGLRPFYSKSERETARKNMELLGIGELSDACFRNLSGGQKQRVLLARALCAATKLLLLDEPVSGMDPGATASFYEAVLKLNQNNMGIIMISHDVHSSLSVAKHILHIGDRGMLFYGTPREYELDFLSE